jgi:hypothetical protein
MPNEIRSCFVKKVLNTPQSLIIRGLNLFLSLTLVLTSMPLSAQKAPASAPAKATASPKSPVPQDPGWPRQKSSPAGQLVYYQPHMDEWKDFKVITGRMAVSLTLAGSKSAVPGVVYLQAQTDVNMETHLVMLHDLQITETHFPSQDDATTAKLGQAVRQFLPPSATQEIALERLIAATQKPEKVTGAPVKNDPPPIFVSYGPSILLLVDGEPVRAPIQKTKLEFVVNSNWPLFYDTAKPRYYLLNGTQWLESGDLKAGWTKAAAIPKDFSKLPDEPNWVDVKKAVPLKSGTAPAPTVFCSNLPAEILTIQGKPVYVKIPGTSLTYVSNTDSDILFDVPASEFYCLIAGRWFRAKRLEGPWSFASADLPADFARIPESCPAARVLTFVPGSPEAEDAVLLAQVPTTVVVNPKEAEAKVNVAYDGPPEFKPIEGTTLSYAANTQDKIIKVGDLYYLCFQGIWFMSTSAQGPWKTADSVPKEIYTIPPSAPVYNVTYVTQTTTSSGQVEASHTAGYMGMFVIGMAVGATIAYGCGYYYPPYFYHGPYPYPIYHPYPHTYGVAVYHNHYTGSYGVARGAYGPYGGVGGAAAYNPHTGTYARAATVYGPGGSRTAAQAYNPYTGGYAATRQGSSPYAQWGSSVATRGGQTVTSQHVTTAYGSRAAAQSSSGGSVVAKSGPGGPAFAGQSSSGDLYAGKDGNVYKKDSSGSWQKYEDGSWSSVEKSAGSAQAQSAKASAQTQKQGASATATSAQPQTQSARDNAQPQAQSGAASISRASAQAQPQAASAQARAGTQPRAQTASAPSTGSLSRPEGQSSQVQSLNQEAQNRQRGSAQSQKWESSQRSSGSSWGGGSGSRSGSSSRSSSGGRRR